MSANKFCPKCDNLLFPKEDAVDKKLLWSCSPECRHQEQAETNIVYEKRLQEPSPPGVVVNDMSIDPVLPRTRNERCPSCGHREAGFFQARAASEVDMSLFFVCCKCSHRWQERPQQHQCQLLHG